MTTRTIKDPCRSCRNNFFVYCMRPAAPPPRLHPAAGAAPVHCPVRHACALSCCLSALLL